MLIATLSSIVVAFASVSVWLWHARRLRWRSWVASAVLVGWVVGVGIKVHIDRTPRSDRTAGAALPSIAWPVGSSVRGAENAATASSAPTSPASPLQVAPVPSLIGGLERRLAEHPDDAAGWALLAQSRAFLGDDAAADAALQKATVLGMDEATLRARVDAAKRTSAPR